MNKINKKGILDNISTNKELPKTIQNAVQTINRDYPLPLYQQLFETLYNVIINKRLEPGNFFATENLLQKETQISRATIRRALEELVRQKLLIRITGKGTFVAINFPDDRIFLPQLKSLTEELNERGMRPGSTLLQKIQINPSEKVAKKLAINSTTLVLYTERIRTGNGIPILYLRSYIPIEIGVSKTDDIPNSLYQLIEQCGRTISSATHTINAAVTPPEIAKHLGIKKFTAGLTMQRTTFDEQGSPVLYEEGIFRSDLYNYTLTMQIN